jgi:hypothetical protein
VRHSTHDDAIVAARRVCLFVCVCVCVCVTSEKDVRTVHTKIHTLQDELRPFAWLINIYQTGNLPHAHVVYTRTLGNEYRHTQAQTQPMASVEVPRHTHRSFPEGGREGGGGGHLYPRRELNTSDLAPQRRCLGPSAPRRGPGVCCHTPTCAHCGKSERSDDIVNSVCSFATSHDAPCDGVKDMLLISPGTMENALSENIWKMDGRVGGWMMLEDVCREWMGDRGAVGCSIGGGGGGGGGDCVWW